MSGIRHQPVAPTEVRVLVSGEEVDPHRHDDHQIIYVSSGVLEVVAAHGKWFTPSTRAVWVPAGTVHVWQVHGATTVHMVGIPHRMAADASPDPSLVLAHPLFRELVIACSAGPATSPQARRLLQVLLDQMRFAPDRASMLPALDDPRLRDVQSLLEADMTVSPSLGELGRRVGASERTLSRLFSDSVGMTFPVWRNQLRLHHASLLLAQRRTVSQVAADSGYSSPSAFITSFQAAFGRTPGSLYRETDAASQ